MVSPLPKTFTPSNTVLSRICLTNFAPLSNCFTVKDFPNLSICLLILALVTFLSSKARAFSPVCRILRIASLILDFPVGVYVLLFAILIPYCEAQILTRTSAARPAAVTSCTRTYWRAIS